MPYITKIKLGDSPYDLRDANARKEAFQEWGGQNLSGAVSPNDSAMSYLHSANRLQFASATGVLIEYSTDGGTTWETYTATDSDKVSLLSGIGSNFYHIVAEDSHLYRW